MKVLVTDGEQRPALAIVRSLAARGVSVIVGAERATSLASSSRHCARHVTYPSPSSDRKGFARWLEDFVSREAVHVLMPVTDVTTHAVCSNAHALRGLTSLAVPGLAAFEFVSHKTRLVEWATRCGVPVPKTWFVDGRHGLPAVLDRVGYPAVVKPARSRYPTRTGWRSASVHYAGDETDLRQLYDEVEYLRSGSSLIQERIVGPGLGVFALFDRGRPLVEFAHRRLREKPPSGGVSVLRESLPLDPRLTRAAARLLGPLAWHGVAMLEFKQDARTGDLFLMEVNGRFWGSLQLAIDAGIDFPWLACELALGRSVAPQEPYRVGVKSRWLSGDLDHLLLRLCRSSRDLHLPDSAPTRWQAVRDFLACSGPDLHYEVISLDDPGPGVYELTRGIAALGMSALDRLRRRALAPRAAPRGRPPLPVAPSGSARA